MGRPNQLPARGVIAESLYSSLYKLAAFLRIGKHSRALRRVEKERKVIAISPLQKYPLALVSTKGHPFASVSRLGLEPRTYGLTCRTGFHPPARGRCGLDFIISPGTTRWGATRKVSEDPACGSFLLIAQSGGLSRLPSLLSCMLPCTAYRRLKGIPANGVVLRRASRPGHSCR